MTPQGWNPLAGLLPVPRGANVYIMQAIIEPNIINGESGKGNRAIIAETNHIKKSCNIRQLARLKS